VLLVKNAVQNIERLAGKTKIFFENGKVEMKGRSEIFLGETPYAPYIQAIKTDLSGAD
jgi:ABC-type thiamine transport system ATPase subunit